MANSKGRKKSLKILGRIFLIAVSILVLFIISAFVFRNYYEDQIEKVVLNEINNQLKKEITVEDISFSVLKDFPFASLSFYNVFAKDVNDTLLKSKRISLQFNVIEILRKNYFLKRIQIENAVLNLEVSEKGTDNYHLLKENENDEDKSFSLQLDQIILKNVTVNYRNRKSKQEYSLLAHNAKIKGEFAESSHYMILNGDFLVNNIISHQTTYVKNQNSTIDLEVNVDQKQGKYEIEKGTFSLDKLAFNVEGYFQNSQDKDFIDIKFTGTYLDLSSVIKKLPEIYKKHFGIFESSGKFFLALVIKGNVGDDKIPNVKAEFNFEQGKIIHKKTMVALGDVEFKGVYSNGINNNTESSSLKINNFSARLKKGKIEGKFELSDFKNPEIIIITDSKINLEDLQEFIHIDTIDDISGKMEIEATYKGKLNNIIELSPKDLLSSTFSGKMKINDMNIKLKGDSKQFKNIDSDVSFNDNNLVIDNLECDVGKSDFMIQGYFKNFLLYLFDPGESLVLDAKLKSRNIELDELLSTESPSSDKAEYKLDFSDHLEAYIDFGIEELSFKKFKASNIAGEMKVKDRLMDIPFLTLKSQDGMTHAKGYIELKKENQIYINCESEIRDVNVKKLFYEFGNFGQSGLTDQNINGIVSADIQFSGIWGSSLKVDPASIITTADLIIENGSLVNYPPLMGLSDHIKHADLAHVNFSTLENQIQIKNKQIIIPEMEIRSDAIDISASGIHSFNDEIEYHLQVLWSELRSNTNKDDQNEFGIVVDDGLRKTTLFFVITGTTDNPIVKYDKKGVKDKIASDFKKEKKNLKKVFQKEFKNPEREKEKELIKKQEDDNFVIEWEESEVDTVNKLQKSNKKKKPEIYIEWDEEDNDNDSLKNK